LPKYTNIVKGEDQYVIIHDHEF